MRRVLESSAKGITMKNLNSGIIENLKIPVPPISIQTQFAQIEAQTELLKTLYQQSLAELEQMYGSLSQRAFRGELGGAMLEKDEKWFTHAILDLHEAIYLSFIQERRLW